MADLKTTDPDALADLSFDSDEELLRWLQSARTPLDMIDTREGRGGQTFYYIRQQHVTQILNRICGHNWDFEVLRERMDEDQITVLGRLTIRIGQHEIVKSQYGGSDVKRSAKDNAPLSVGDDFKSAASDALKKCAQMVGIGLDLSLPIQESTMKRLHATGKDVFGDQWDKKRRWSIRVLTGGKQSSKELLDIEGRILIGVMDGHSAPIVKQARRKLKS